MDDRTPAGLARPGERLLGGTRLLLSVFSVLTALAFVSLFVGSARTDRYFAWTIEPPVTAAFLGASYAAGCVLVLLSLRVGSWAHVRIPFLTVLVFTVATLVATLLHLDRFHVDASDPLARFAAWFWLGIYVVVPVGMLVMLLRQDLHEAGSTGMRVALPTWFGVALAVQAGVLLAVGAALFSLPSVAGWLWPWTLTPLTARVVAAWLLAFGVGAILALRSGDLGRLDLAALTYVVLGALQVVVLVRFAGSVRWGSGSAWGYLVTLASILVTAGYTLARGRGQ